MLYETARSEREHYLYHHLAHNLHFQNHLHSTFEFIFVTQGVLNYTISGRTEEIHAGEAILALPNRLHAASTASESENHTLIFSSDFVPDFYASMSNRDFGKPVFRFPYESALCALDEKKDIFLQKSILYLICSEAWRQCDPRDAVKSDDMLIQRIALYVQNHFAEEIELASLAKSLGYSYCYLSDFINNAFGMNFRGVVNGYRVDAAAQFLSNRELTITEVAERSGFETIRSFNRVFGRVHGMTPGEYRKRKLILADGAPTKSDR